MSKHILREFDTLFINECKKKGMDSSEAISALLEDKTRMELLDNMVRAESTKTQVVMVVEPGHPILEQMFINKSKTTEEE